MRTFTEHEIIEAMHAERKDSYEMAKIGVIQETVAGIRCMGILGVADRLGLQDEYVNGEKGDRK